MWNHELDALVKSTQPTRYPSEDELSRLADLARIPQENRGSFSSSVTEDLLPRVWAWAFRPTLTKPRSKQLSKAVSAVLAARQAIIDIESEFVALRPSEEGWWSEECWGDAGRPEDFTNDEAAEQERSAFLQRDLLGSFEQFLFYVGENPGPDPLPQSPRRGRRSGSVGNRAFVALVRSLLIRVKRAGGRLTLEKNAGQGTLIDAIRLLEAYAPPGVVPKVLPHSTLQRIKSEPDNWKMGLWPAIPYANPSKNSETAEDPNGDIPF